MVNELCPYNKYFDETSNLGNRKTGLPNNDNGNSNSKIQVNDNANPTSSLDRKQIEVN